MKQSSNTARDSDCRDAVTKTEKLSAPGGRVTDGRELPTRCSVRATRVLSCSTISSVPNLSHCSKACVWPWLCPLVSLWPWASYESLWASISQLWEWREIPFMILRKKTKNNNYIMYTLNSYILLLNFCSYIGIAGDKQTNHEWCQAILGLYDNLFPSHQLPVVLNLL